MQRDYLHEDIEQIRRYFPGARTIAIRTPFDLTPPENRAQLLSDDTTDRSDTSRNGWYGDLLWTRS